MGILAYWNIGIDLRTLGLKLVLGWIWSWPCVYENSSPALVCEIAAWEAVPLVGKDMNESNWDYVYSSLFTKVRKTLLATSLTLIFR